MDIFNSIVIFVVGVLASSFGTLVGGGALITIPILILLGLPAHTAIGTSRLGAMGVQIGGWYGFSKKGMIDYRIGITQCVPAFLGSILGASFALEISEDVLRRVIAIITILILGFVLLQPKIGVEKSRDAVTRRQFVVGVILNFVIFVYQGFYGAGSGTFVTYVLILIYGQTFLQSAATRKIPQLVAVVMASVIFAMAGAINYPSGIALFVGSLAGSYLGAFFSDKIGNVWIKKFFVVIVLIMAIKLLI